MIATYPKHPDNFKRPLVMWAGTSQQHLMIPGCWRGVGSRKCDRMPAAHSSAARRPRLQSTILNACADEDSFAGAALDALVGRLRRDSETLVIRPAGKQIANCTGCFGCWFKTPGVCVIDDDCRAITREIARADRLVFLTPVVFGGYHPDLKAVLERSIGILAPFFRIFRGEMHHPLRERSKAYEFIAIGIQDRADEETASAFRQHVWRNALNFNGLTWQAGSLVRAAGTAEVAARIDKLLERMEVL